MLRCLSVIVFLMLSSGTQALSVSSHLPADLVQQNLRAQKWQLLDLLLDQEQAFDPSLVSEINLKQVEEPVRLSGRQIPIRLDYRYSEFNQPLYFQGAHFFQSPLLHKVDAKAEISFNDAIFEQDFDLFWSRFYQDFSLQRAHINQNFYLTSSVFKSPLYANQASFMKSAVLDSNLFEDKLLFRSVKVSDDLSLQTSSLMQGGDFTLMTVGGNIDFSESRILGPIDLSNTSIKGSLSFRSALLASQLSLSRLYIGEMLDFSESQIQEKLIDLTEVLPLMKNNKIKINLSHVDPSFFLLSYDRFRLVFDKNLSHSEKVFLYETIIEMQRKNGFSQGVREATIEYKKYLYRHQHAYLTDFFQHYGWDYGFERERVLLWIVAVIVFIASINALFYRSLVENAFKITFLSRHAHSKYVESSPVLRYIFYFPVTLVFTILILFSHAIGIKHDLNNLKSRSVWVNSYLLLLMIIGVICSLFMLNYILGGSLG